MTPSTKPVALVFSDLHLNIWAKFNDNHKRTLDGFEVLLFIAKQCTRLGVPAIFCGDLFHKPEHLDPELCKYFNDYILKLNKSYPSFKVYLIAGNHDIKHKNSLEPGKFDHGWVDYLTNYPILEDIFIKLNPFEAPHKLTNTINLYGVPYIDHNIGLNGYISDLKLDNHRKSLLVLHTDYPGAKDTDGRTVDSVENLNVNTLNKFDLVLCGHIHKPQRLAKKVYMVGAPLQQRRTDRDCKMGYWILHEDLSMEFKHLGQFPVFIDVDNIEEVKQDGNYYTVLPKIEKVPDIVTHKITKQLTKSKLARQYMRTKGIKDSNKKKLLSRILNESEKLC